MHRNLEEDYLQGHVGIGQEEMASDWKIVGLE